MSNHLFVTLYLISGWSKSWVEIPEYKNHEKPETIIHEGKTFNLVGVPLVACPYQEEDGHLSKVKMIEGELVYFEVA